MKQISEVIKGVTLYECNPEANRECDKRYCKHNINAIEGLCSCTLNKDFALEIGQAAERREYTPPV